MRMSWETGKGKGKLQTVIENVKNRQEIYSIEKKLLRSKIPHLKAMLLLDFIFIKEILKSLKYRVDSSGDCPEAPKPAKSQLLGMLHRWV